LQIAQRLNQNCSDLTSAILQIFSNLEFKKPKLKKVENRKYYNGFFWKKHLKTALCFIYSNNCIACEPYLFSFDCKLKDF
jgi:hypothetical protein